MFDIYWDKPQISSSLPSGNLAVYNANTAQSKGFELESTGPLFVPRLSYLIGFAYADAKLTSNFSLPANNGEGTIVPGLLSGTAGEQLPGSPKTSLNVGLIYDLILSPGYDLSLSGNSVYRSARRAAARPERRHDDHPALIALRGHQRQCDAAPRALACDLVRDQPVRQVGDPGAALAAQPAGRPDQRLPGQPAAGDRGATGLRILTRGSGGQRHAARAQRGDQRLEVSLVMTPAAR